MKFKKDLFESRQSAEKKDLNYLVYKIHPKEKWMVLAEYFRDATFFDI